MWQLNTSVLKFCFEITLPYLCNFLSLFHSSPSLFRFVQWRPGSLIILPLLSLISLPFTLFSFLIPFLFLYDSLFFYCRDFRVCSRVLSFEIFATEMYSQKYLWLLQRIRWLLWNGSVKTFKFTPAHLMKWYIVIVR